MDWNLLVERGETTNVDFKAACKWDGEDRARLTKAIAAMANTRDGGIIVIGIDDDRTGGKPKLASLSSEQLASFDPTKVAAYVNERFEPDIQLRIEKPLIDGLILAPNAGRGPFGYFAPFRLDNGRRCDLPLLQGGSQCRESAG